MTESAPVTTTVMFADVCRSAYLFNRLGDEKAARLINEVLRLTASIVETHQGEVLRSKGDDVLCIFSDPVRALHAAIEVHARVRKYPVDEADELSMRIGINSGTALLSDGEIFGDTVNTAARLSVFAKAGQTIVSSHTINMLDRFAQQQLRSVGEISLKGKSGPLPVFELLDSDETDEITQVPAVKLHYPRSDQLYVQFKSQRDKLDFLLVRYLLGRHPDCDLILNHPLVSRHHAEIQYQNNQFVLIDFSTNGTELILNGEARRLHHNQAALRGNGSIFLGGTIYNREFEITFNASGGSRGFTQTYS